MTGWAWDFGDGQIGSGPTITHPYGSVATFSVTLKVTDNGGATSSVTNPVTTSAVTNPIAFVGAAHGGSGSSTTQQLTVPTATAAGNTMLLFLTTSTTSPWIGPTGVTGWTQLATFTNGSTVSTLWSRRAVSGDGGKTVKFTSSASHKAVLDLAIYSGVGGAAPVVARVGDSARSAHVTSSLTAPAGAWVISLWADKSETTTAWTTPAGTTRRDTSLGTGSGRFTSLLADSGGPVAGGPTGALTAMTNANSTYADMWTVALSPG